MYFLGEVIQASVTEISLSTVTVDKEKIILVSSADPVSILFVTNMAAVPNTTLNFKPVTLDILF